MKGTRRAGGDPPPPSVGGGGGNLRRSAIRGSALSMAGFVAGQFLRLGSNLILTRLLFPAVFGQVALVYVFVQGLTLFSDVGTGPAVIQSPRGADPEFLNTAWTIQCLRGALLWVGTWLIAGPVASFYGQPMMVWLLPAAGAGAFIDGFYSLSIQLARRNLQLGFATLVELAAQVVGVVATILLVLAHRSIYGANQASAAWAIVGGGLISNVARLAMSHTVLPGIRHRFHWDRESARVLFSFGRWVFFSTMLTFLAGQSDRMIFGKLIPMEMLGVYGIAAMLAALPTQAVDSLGGSVVFPALSRVTERPDFRALFWRTRLPLLLAGATLATGLIASGPFFIQVLYDARYQQAGWVLQFLAVMTWFQVLEATNSAAALAQGRVYWLTAGNAAKLVGLLTLIPVGFHFDGFRGALVGLVSAEALKYLTSMYAAARRGLTSLGRDFGLSLLIAALATLASLVGHRAATGAYASLKGFLAAGTLATGGWGLLAFLFLRRRPQPPA